MRSPRSRTLAGYIDDDDDDVPQNFTFNGKIYDSYQDMVNARRQRNLDRLASSGLLGAKDAIGAPVQKKQRNRRSQPVAEAIQRPMRQRKKTTLYTPEDFKSGSGQAAAAAAGRQSGEEMVVSSESGDGHEYESSTRNYKTAEKPSNGDDEISWKRTVSQRQIEANRQNIKHSRIQKEIVVKRENELQDCQIIVGFANDKNCKYVKWHYVDNPQCPGTKVWTLGLSQADCVMSQMEKLQGVTKRSWHGLTRERQLTLILTNHLRFHVIKESSSSDGGLPPTGKKWKLWVFHPMVQKESDGTVDMEKIAKITVRSSPKTVNPFEKPKVKVKTKIARLWSNPFGEGLHLGVFPGDDIEDIKTKAKKLIKNNPSATKAELENKLRAAGLMTKGLSCVEKGKRLREEGRMTQPVKKRKKKKKK